jgi:hypothetical protein
MPSTSGDPKIKADFPSVRKLTLINLFLTHTNAKLISSVDSSVGNFLPFQQFFCTFSLGKMCRIQERLSMQLFGFSNEVFNFPP